MLTIRIAHPISSIFVKSTNIFSLGSLKSFRITEQVRFAGHSKWQNIKHTKLSKDLQKNLLYNRHIDEIKLAVRDGKSANPKNNSKLERAIENAKKAGVAMSTVNGALAKFEKALKNPKSVMFEYKGPQGLIIVVSVNTDNKNRTWSEINYLTKKINLVKASNLLSAFYHKGYVHAKPPPDLSNIDEKALEDAIEVGAEEVERDENNSELLMFICAGVDINTVKSKLETRKYIIEDSAEVYEPRSVLQLSEEETNKLYETFDKIDEIPEVNRIFTNLA